MSINFRIFSIFCYFKYRPFKKLMFDLDVVAIEIKLILKMLFFHIKKNGFNVYYCVDSVFISQKATDKSLLADYTKRKELNIVYTLYKDYI